MTLQPLPRAAIAGTGFMGLAHAEALHRLGVPIQGVLGSTPSKSRAAAERLRAAHAYASFEELLADPLIGVVHIVTPNQLHYPMVKAALAAGKHVMCEKPLAMTTHESAELAQLAAHTKLITAVNYNIRFYPMCQEARARVLSGNIGRPHGVVGRYVQDWLLFPTDYNWRVRADQGGVLRAVADVGTHWLDLVQTITGQQVEAVCADLSTVLPTRRKPNGEVETYAAKLQNSDQATQEVAVDTEDQAGILLRFSDGLRGSLWVSQMTAGRKNHLEFELSGAKASLAWDSERPNELWVGHRDRSNELLLKDPSLAATNAAACMAYPGGHNEGYPDTFKQCFRAFYARIASPNDNRLPAPPSFADGHREIVLCEAILRSHQTQTWVQVPQLEKGTEL